MSDKEENLLELTVPLNPNTENSEIVLNGKMKEDPKKNANYRFKTV
jgi:hypothetical protein